MINTQLKTEAKIPNGSKVVSFTKVLSLLANLTLKVKVKILKPIWDNRYQINSSLEGKIRKGSIFNS